MSVAAASLPAVPIDLAFFHPANGNAGSWKVLHSDGTVLFESSDETVARSRLDGLAALAKIRLGAGRTVSGADLVTLFPPTAPAPLVLGALSADDLKREDVFDEPSQTWTMRNVEVFRSGTALKKIGDEWTKLAFTADDVKDLVEAFAEIGWTPPVKLVDHTSHQPLVLADLPTIARTVGLRAAEVKDPAGASQLGAFADLEKVAPSLHDAIRAGKLHGRSIEFFRNVIPRMKGEGKYPLVLKAVTLLGADLPAVRGMPPIDVAPMKLSGDEPTETLALNVEKPIVDPAPKTGVIELTVEQYEKDKQARESLAAEVSRQKAANEELAKSVARLSADRRVESATSAASRLRDAGKITPAQEPVVLSLLKTLDDDAKEAVVVTVLSSDGKATETKQSQRGALLSLLDSFQKHPNAPGQPATRGDRKSPESGRDFVSLSAEDKDAAAYNAWGKLCADQKVAKDSIEGKRLYDKAVRGLRDGTIAVPEVTS